MSEEKKKQDSRQNIAVDLDISKRFTRLCKKKGFVKKAVTDKIINEWCDKNEEKINAKENN